MSTITGRQSGSAERRRFSFSRSRPAIIASGLVVLAVLLANAVYLLGVRSNDPMLYHSGSARRRMG